MFEQVYSKTGIRAIVGSGFLWAWFDALYMGSFFPSANDNGLLAEAATGCLFLLGVPLLVALLARQALAHQVVETKVGQLVVGLSGTVGSLLIVAGNYTGWLPVIATGCLLASVYMALGPLSWGAVYSMGGTISATPYVSGTFACAVVLDMPLLFMFPEAASVFYSLFPIVSCAVFLGIDPEDRSYRTVLDKAVVNELPGRRGWLRNLGVPVTILAAYGLVMMGFGFFQHLISFSPVQGSGQAYGMFVQIARGIVGVILFVTILRNPQHSRMAYRICLPLMIAGCMIMPFCLNDASFAVPAVLIIGGYTAFDLFTWVIFCSLAATQSCNPLGTIAVMRIATSACHALGTACGIELIGFGPDPIAYAAETTTFVGYLIVMALVLLLTSEEAFALTNGYYDYRRTVQSIQRNATLEETSSEDDLDATGLLDARFAELGLTARESEVARLLAHGRTQKWIADYLCISENTVGTHLRRIYQKAGVHKRQQFLDVLAGETSASHKTRDMGNSL